MEYDYENKCIQCLAKKDDIEMIEFNKGKGTMDVYDNDYLVFTIPFELNPNLTIKEQAEYIINFVHPMELDVSNKKM